MNTFQVICVLMFVLPLATLILRGKYVSTKATRSQALLVFCAVFALSAFDTSSKYLLIVSFVCFSLYLRRLYVYLRARRISERYGAPCPKHREA